MKLPLRTCYKASICLAILALFLAACKPVQSSAPVQAGEQSTSTPGELVETFPTPTITPTSEPLAARVNDEGISLAEYQDELGRYQAAIERDATLEERKLVLDDLISQTLLAQGAVEAGYTVDDSLLQSRYQALADQVGGTQAMTDWMQSNGYSEESFRLSLARSIHAAWMRDKIIGGVSQTAEQVHARQILFSTADAAAQAQAQLQAGADFATLAKAADPLTGGDLGWFPRGYLLQPDVEKAAFDLQPGQHSPVIQTPIGYHIIQVIERDPEYPLNPQALLALQKKALQDWLEQRRSQSAIEIYI